MRVEGRFDSSRGAVIGPLGGSLDRASDASGSPTRRPRGKQRDVRHLVYIGNLG